MVHRKRWFPRRQISSQQPTLIPAVTAATLAIVLTLVGTALVVWAGNGLRPYGWLAIGWAAGCLSVAGRLAWRIWRGH
jgi:hypothetical protein